MFQLAREYAIVVRPGAQFDAAMQPVKISLAILPGRLNAGSAPSLAGTVEAVSNA